MTANVCLTLLFGLLMKKELTSSTKQNMIADRAAKPTSTYRISGP
jgi:hypothetical protein